jgi:hypothetical protein
MPQQRFPPSFLYGGWKDVRTDPECRLPWRFFTSVMWRVLLTGVVIKAYFGPVSCYVNSTKHNPYWESGHLVVKTGHLIVCREIIALYSDNLTQYINLLFWQNTEFLGAFATLWKRTISFVTSFGLSVPSHGTARLSLDGFSWNLILSIFRKSVEKIKF